MFRIFLTLKGIPCKNPGAVAPGNEVLALKAFKWQLESDINDDCVDVKPEVPLLLIFLIFNANIKN